MAVSLPKTQSGPSSASYTSSDDLVKLTISHAYGKRARRTARLDFSKLSPDVFVPTTNVRHSMSCFIVIDEPKDGFTNTEAKQVADALVAYLSASTGANITKMLGGES